MSPRNQLKHNKANSEDITGFGDATVREDLLRSLINQSAACIVFLRICALYFACVTKVNNLGAGEVVWILEADVCRLYISMHVPCLVYVLHSKQNTF